MTGVFEMNVDDGFLGDGRKKLRKSVRMEARIRQRGTPFDINIVDLSQSGFRGETIYNLAVGTRLYVTLPELAPLEATVVWRDPVRVGCVFTAQLHRAVFDHIVARSQ